MRTSLHTCSHLHGELGRGSGRTDWDWEAVGQSGGGKDLSGKAGSSETSPH